MNIRNRLEKLEKGANLDSEFCSCSRETVVSVIEPDEDRTEEEDQRLVSEPEKPETCAQCGKEIEKRIIIIQDI